MSYHELSVAERATIQIDLLNNFSPRRIARLLNRSPSTVSRKVRRNRTALGQRLPRPAHLDNLAYDLPATPCEAVIRDGLTCFHPAALARKFPVEEGFQSYIGIPIFGRDGGVLGHLAFLDRRPMDGGMLVDAVFRLFAARAAAELERKAMAGALAQRFG